MKLIVYLLIGFFYSQDQEVETPVEELGSLQEPGRLSFHFDTIGWKILLACSSILLIVLLIRQAKIYRQKAYRRKAVKQLNDLLIDPKSNQDIIMNTMVILKSVAMERYGRSVVASLYGKQWLEFLDTKYSGNYFVNNHDLFHRVIYMQESISDELLPGKNWS